jgi:nicotinamidase-related amidase
MLAGMDPSKHFSFVRSPELMSASSTGLLVVDVQQRLIRLLPDHGRIVWNIRRLLDAAKLFGLTVLATEQYPKGLGGTVGELAGQLGSIAAKTTFSSAGCEAIAGELERLPVHQWLVVGIEAHVCVLQTVLDLLSAGFRVFVAVDAIGSRHEVDCRVALARMESAGATLTTCESALFEWCADSNRAEFKQLSQLIKETPPNVG